VADIFIRDAREVEAISKLSRVQEKLRIGATTTRR